MTNSYHTDDREPVFQLSLVQSLVYIFPPGITAICCERPRPTTKKLGWLILICFFLPCQGFFSRRVDFWPSGFSNREKEGLKGGWFWVPGHTPRYDRLDQLPDLDMAVRGGCNPSQKTSLALTHTPPKGPQNTLNPPSTPNPSFTTFRVTIAC